LIGAKYQKLFEGSGEGWAEERIWAEDSLHAHLREGKGGEGRGREGRQTLKR
jgi:hypothetical protein